MFKKFLALSKLTTNLMVDLLKIVVHMVEDNVGKGENAGSVIKSRHCTLNEF